MKRKSILLLVVVVAILAVFLWVFIGNNNEASLGDYRPMVYVQNCLYGETAEITSALPSDIVFLDTIKKVVPQNETMPQENFTSNVHPVGSRIFWNEEEPSTIYIQISTDSQEKYSKYTLIE